MKQDTEQDWRTHPEGVAHLFYLDWVSKESVEAHPTNGVEPVPHGENAPDSPDAT